MGPRSLILVILAVSLWGGSAVSSQFALDFFAPLFMGGMRFSLAAVFMVGWCLYDRASLLLKPGQWIPTVSLGLLLYLQIGTFNLGCAWSSTSHAVILVNSFVLWVAALEKFFHPAARLRWWQCLGLGLCAAGCCCLLLGPRGQEELDIPTVPGDAMLVLSGLILAVKILYTKTAVQQVSPPTLILWHDILGAGLFFATSLVFEPLPHKVPSISALLAILYSGLIVSGFCFGANAVLLRRHGAAQVSVFSFASPLIGVALGILLRGDQMSASLVIAGFFVAAGIFLVSYLPDYS